MKVFAAGDYRLALRFISGVNLSWYDKSKYRVENFYCIALDIEREINSRGIRFHIPIATARVGKLDMQ